jgi:Mg/Co/Ni transporter MgtE
MAIADQAGGEAMTYDTEHHDDVVVEREGTGVGTILGIILAIVVVLAIIWFFFLGGAGNGTNPNNGGNDTTNQNQVQQQVPGNGY